MDNPEVDLDDEDSTNQRFDVIQVKDEVLLLKFFGRFQPSPRLIFHHGLIPMVENVFTIVKGDRMKDVRSSNQIVYTMVLFSPFTHIYGNCNS